MNLVHVLETIPQQTKKLHELNVVTYERMENRCFVD